MNTRFCPRFKQEKTKQMILSKLFAAINTGSRGDVFVVRTSKPVENP